MAHPNIRKVALTSLALILMVLLGLLVYHIRDFPANYLASTIFSRLSRIFYFPILMLLATTVFTATFWGVVIFTLCLQWLIPAMPNQKIFSLNFRQDIVWFFYETVLHALIVVTYVDLLTYVYGSYFSRLTITSLGALPGWFRFLLALLLVDFLYWAQHYCNHKVPVLWQFHALHHSQKELNFFTDFRYHVLEYVVRHTFLVIPLLILKVDPPVIVFVAIFQKWYSRFYHGNIRTNLGPLRYILVTPQSHRIHHSIEPGHRDMNFGAILSIWDWIFGTQCKNGSIYPETGIEDEAFPHECDLRLKSLLLTPFYQMLHPLKVVMGSRIPNRLTQSVFGPDLTGTGIGKQPRVTQPIENEVRCVQDGQVYTQLLERAVNKGHP